MLRKLNNEIKFQSNVARSKSAKAFLNAAHAGDVTEIQHYINAHAHDKNKSAMHVYDKVGTNALMFAADAGHEHIVQLLLDAGLNIDAQNKSGVTALHCASVAGHLAIVRLLVKHGANLTLETNADFDSTTNFTAENLVSIKKGKDHKDIAAFLYMSHILKVVCSKNKEDLQNIQCYIKNNPDILHVTDEKENTILDTAAMSGNFSIVQAIIKEVKNVPTACIYEAIKKAKTTENNEKVICFLQAKFLIDAVKSGNLKEIERYLIDYPDAVNVMDAYRSNALMVAAECGHEKIVEMLLAAHININAKNQFGDTALHWAANKGNVTIARLLVNNGADLVLKNNEQHTAVDVATQEEHEDMANFLRHSIVLKAAYGKNKEDLQNIPYYIKTNPDILHVTDEKENTILDIVAMSGNFFIVQAIIKEVKNVPTACIYEAIKKAKTTKNNEKIVCFLQTKFLIEAVKSGNLKEIERYLTDYPDAVNLIDAHGNNALILAAQYGHEKIVEILLASHININAKNQFGDTALHWAANKGNVTIARLLVNNGADLVLKNNEQHTAVDVATQQKHGDIADFLRGPISINLEAAYGKNKDDLETIRGYIKAIPNIISFVDEKGNNILDIAAISGSLPIVQAIINEVKDIPKLCLLEAIAKAKTAKSSETVIHLLQNNLQQRIVNYKTKSHFNSGRKLEKKESKGMFSHETSKTKKTIPASLGAVSLADLPQKYKNNWYLKKAKQAEIAQIEVVAQELFRLLIPGHPKTRLVMAQDGTYFVASKEIEGAMNLPDDMTYTAQEKIDWNNALRNGVITGLGEMATFARLIHDIDVKNGNQKIDFLRRVIKFDGDQCLAHIQDKTKPFTPITPATIAQLPFSGNDTPYNWLGCVGKGVQLTHPLLDADLSSHPRIRAEINHALLKIMLLPDDLIKKFISFYVIHSNGAKVIYDDFIDKRNQMRDAAMENQDFLNYLSGSQAEKQCKDYIAYLQTFKTIGKNFIFDLVSEPEKQMLSQFDAVRNRACEGSKKLKS